MSTKVPRLCIKLARFMRSERKTIQDVSQGASVSTKLVVDVRNAGEISLQEGSEKLPSWMDDLVSGSETRSNRFMSARASSLAKLYYYIGNNNAQTIEDLSPVEALNDFGLEGFLDSGGLSIAKRVVSPISLRSSGNGVDPVMRRLNKKDGKKIYASVFNWPPFNQRGSSNINDDIGDWIVKRWVDTINPGVWKAETNSIKIDNFKDAITLLQTSNLNQSTTENDSIDLVFGLYDNLARRLHDIEFVNFPGLANSLAAVIPTKDLDSYYLQGPGYVASNKGNHDVSIWSKLLWEWPSLNENYVKIFTYIDEVGDIFVKGVCGIADDNKNNFEPINEFDAIQAQFLEACSNSDSKSRSPIFVGDRGYCHKLNEYIQAKLGSGYSMVVGDHIPLRNTADATDARSRFMINSYDHAPVYKFGVAVSSKAHQFKKILETSLLDEIISNASSLAAVMYGEMLFKSRSIKITPINEDVLGLQQRELLASKTIDYLKVLSHGQIKPVKDYVRYVTEQIKEKWLNIPKESEYTKLNRSKNHERI